MLISIASAAKEPTRLLFPTCFRMFPEKGLTWGATGTTQGLHEVAKRGTHGLHGVRQGAHRACMGCHRGHTGRAWDATGGTTGSTWVCFQLVPGCFRKKGLHGVPQGAHRATHGGSTALVSDLFLDVSGKRACMGCHRGHTGLTRCATGAHRAGMECHRGIQGLHGVPQGSHRVARGDTGATQGLHGLLQGSHRVARDATGATQALHGLPQGPHRARHGGNTAFVSNLFPDASGKKGLHAVPHGATRGKYVHPITR